MASKKEIYIQIIEEAWADLKVEKRIGRGAYGSVFACTKSDGSISVQEAVKIIELSYEDIADAAKSINADPGEYFQGKKSQAESEIRQMYELKSPHIVHINDYKTVNKGEDAYILIRMDILRDLSSLQEEHLDDSKKKAGELAKKVCLDICEALAVCEKSGIVHRDIKPQNILMSDNGDFYLGDFGIARELEEKNLSSKGTDTYRAPEVAEGRYDTRVDLYSLGIVLYQIVNHWRLPFYPYYPDPITPKDDDLAQVRRLGKVEVPPPDNCTAKLWPIIRQLCEPEADKRYFSAKEVSEAVHAIDVEQATIQINNVQNNVQAQQNNISVISVQEEKNEAHIYQEKSKEVNQVKKSQVAYNKPNPVNARAVMPPAKNIFQMSISERGKVLLFATAIIIGVLTIRSIPALIVYGLKNDMYSTTDSRDYSNSESASEKDVVMDSLGNKYGKAMLISDEGFVEYKVEKSAKVFNATLACADDAYSDEEFRVKVILDENSDWPVEDFHLNRLSEPVRISVDVSDVETIRIETVAITGSVHLIVADKEFWKSGEASKTNENKTTKPTKKKLTSQKIAQALHCDAEVRTTAQNSIGDEFEDALRIRKDSTGPKEARVTYYLGGEYTKLTANISCDDEVGQDAEFDFCVYYENEDMDPVYRIPINRLTELTPIELDLTGAKYLSFAIEGQTGWNEIVLVSDGFLE